MILVVIYYFASTKKEEKPVEITDKKEEIIIPSEKLTDNESPHPDYHKLFNDVEYINEQEKLR